MICIGGHFFGTPCISDSTTSQVANMDPHQKGYDQTMYFNLFAPKRDNKLYKRAVMID